MIISTGQCCGSITAGSRARLWLGGWLGRTFSWRSRGNGAGSTRAWSWLRLGGGLRHRLGRGRRRNMHRVDRLFFVHHAAVDNKSILSGLVYLSLGDWGHAPHPLFTGKCVSCWEQRGRRALTSALARTGDMLHIFSSSLRAAMATAPINSSSRMACLMAGIFFNVNLDQSIAAGCSADCEWRMAADIRLRSLHCVSFQFTTSTADPISLHSVSYLSRKPSHTATHSKH